MIELSVAAAIRNLPFFTAEGAPGVLSGDSPNTGVGTITLSTQDNQQSLLVTCSNRPDPDNSGFSGEMELMLTTILIDVLAISEFHLRELVWELIDGWHNQPSEIMIPIKNFIDPTAEPENNRQQLTALMFESVIAAEQEVSDVSMYTSRLTFSAYHPPIQPQFT